MKSFTGLCMWLGYFLLIHASPVGELSPWFPLKYLF